MVTGFTVVSVGIRALAQGTPAPLNPFSSFADVFPGQPANAIEVRGFLCIASPYGSSPGLPDEHCALRLAAGAFSQVEVVVSQGVVFNISFVMRDKTLRLGDLPMISGRPLVHQSDHSILCFFPSSGVYAWITSHTGQFSFFLPVESVYFTTARAKDFG
jgi:hypothetical protein